MFGSVARGEPGPQSDVDFLVEMQDGDDNQILIDAASGDILSTTPSTPPAAPSKSKETVSSSTEVQIVCSTAGLKMIRLADQRILAQSALPVKDCIQIAWTSDGSAAALVTDRGEVYVWLPDGSDPKMIGDALQWATPIWSPDDTQILLAAVPENTNSDPSIISFNIAYRDGRPMLKPGTEIEAGNQWEWPGSTEWLTNTIIYNRHCGTYYCVTDYYDARTGHFIIRNSYADWGGREAALSLDNRWVVMEVAPRAANWDSRWEINQNPEQDRVGLIVCDLQTLRRSLVIQSKAPESEFAISSDSSLKFLGWNANSSLFYLIHFPVGGPAYDLPTGLLAMYPKIGYIEPVVPGVAFGLASPDGEHVFLVTAENMEENSATDLQAAIYRMDGTAITTPQPIAEYIKYSSLNEIDIFASSATRLIPSEWSPDGQRLAFADPHGNLWLMDTTGKTMRLVSGLPVEDWRQDNLYNGHQGTQFHWSPDGQFLLIRRTTNYWIAHVTFP